MNSENKRDDVVPDTKGNRPIGIDSGKGWIADDFDAPLPEEIQDLFEGRHPSDPEQP